MLKISMLFFTSILSTAILAKSAELIPIESFASLPAVSNPLISPDGENIIAISPINGEEMVVVTTFGGVEVTPVVRLNKEQNRIEDIQWANNSRVLIYTSFNKLVYNKRRKIHRVYAVNIDGSDVVELKLPKLLQHDYAEMFSDLSLVSVLPEDDKHILFQAYTGRDKTPAVFKFNIYDSSVEKVVAAAHEIDDWVATSNGDVHIGFKYDYNKNTEQQTVDIFFRPDINSADWQNIYSYNSYEDFYMSPVSISEDKKSLVVRTDFEAYKAVLRNFNIEKKAFGEILYQVDGYDISSARFSDNKLVGFAYTDDYYRINYFDPELKSRQEMIKKTFAKYQSYIYDSSKDKNRLIISASASNSPAKFFIVDLAAKKANFWFSQYAGLENKNLPSKQKFTYKAKDGLELTGYITPGTKGEKSPLVVFPHGGPASRDSMHFDIWTQLLARRGVAVLQMNFRGSEGYGNALEVGGYKEYGKLMQSDVYDAIEWVKANNMADTKNMCMVGLSYGGYVALVAGYQKPAEFKCIVSVAGLSDLPERIKSFNFWSSSDAATEVTMGDINNDEELRDLKENSPINHVDAYKAPILLIHGEYDQVVKPAQSENMYSALKRKRKKVEYIELDKGTHNIDSPKNRAITFKAIDKFLAEYLDEE